MVRCRCPFCIAASVKQLLQAVLLRYVGGQLTLDEKITATGCTKLSTQMLLEYQILKSAGLQ